MEDPLDWQATLVQLGLDLVHRTIDPVLMLLDQPTFELDREDAG